MTKQTWGFVWGKCWWTPSNMSGEAEPWHTTQSLWKPRVAWLFAQYSDYLQWKICLSRCLVALCHGLTPARNSPTKLLTHLPPAHPSGTGERLGRLKWENSLDSDKNTLMDKAKATHTQAEQNKEFFPMGRQVFSRTAGLQWLGKRNTITLNVPPFVLLFPTLCTEHDAIQCEKSLGSVGVSHPCCVHSQLLVHPHPPP